MYLPLVHHTGTGLWVGPDRIVLMALVRFRDSVRTVSLQEEPIVEGRIECALNRLAERCPPSNYYVVSNLDTATVKHVLLNGPAFDDVRDRSHWIQRQIDAALPGGKPNELFCTSHVVFPVENSRTKVLVGIARADVVEARARLLRQAGFRPLGLSTLPSVFAAAFMLDPKIIEGATHVSWNDPDDGFRISLMDGYVSELEYPFVTEPDDTLPIGSTVIPAGFTDPDGLLRPHTIPAAAMAMVRLYSGLEHLDFLDKDTKTLYRNTYEKSQSVRLMGNVFGTIALLWLLISVTVWQLSRFERQTQSEINAIAAEWQAIERRIDEVERLRVLLRETSSVVSSRTRMTPILDLVGASVPTGLWLTSLSISPVSAHAYDVTLEGATRNEFLIPRLLDNLRIEPTVETAELSYSRKGATTRPLRSPRRDLQPATTRFKIMVHANCQHNK